MSVFRGDCPHCGTKSVAFSVVHEAQAKKQAERLWDTLAICGYCSRGILASFGTPHAESPPRDYLGRGRGHLMQGPAIAPTPPSTSAPQYTPENVAHFYSQGMENLSGNWDAAGQMFRKSLEVGLKHKFPDIEGSLHERINGAAEQNKLTPDLAEWSHEVRLGGNDAAHDEEPFKKEEAERLSTFTELVFLYLFTLPGMLREARDTPEADAEE